jgi:nitronate monooxygenase
MTMKRVDDFRLRFGKRELVPIMIGGMGVDISTTELALEAARLGGVGHISDAMINTVADRRYQTKFVKDKLKQYKFNVENADKAVVKFDLGTVEEATRLHVRSAMDRKQGEGMIFINCMEKLTMNAPKETLKVRLTAALDAGIDGITLAAGLHLGSLALIEDHPRFRDAKIGIIVSSVRALQLFLKKNARLNRLPDFIVVEGPLAGGHLGFGMDWAAYDLATITAEVVNYLREEKLDIPVIPAGGIFTGSDAVGFLEQGAAAVQVATRFTVAKECGLPEKVQQEYFKATEDDIEVNQVSPTGYPMRMVAEHPGARRVSVMDKTCLCTHMRNFDCWTCGQYTYRLKDTTVRRADGSYQVLSAEHIFHDYQFSTDNKIALPVAEAAA